MLEVVSGGSLDNKVPVLEVPKPCATVGREVQSSGHSVGFKHGLPWLATNQNIACLTYEVISNIHEIAANWAEKER